MTEAHRIADLAESVLCEGGWIEVSLRDLFHSLTAAEAAAHPIPGAHSAWEIVLHLTTWHDAVRWRIAGEIFEVSDAEDWPTPPQASEANWQVALNRFEQSFADMVAAIRGMKPEQMDQIVPNRPFSFYTMLHGVVQHNLYHGGQVMMLRKALRGAAV